MADIYNEILNTFKLQDHTEATTQAIKLDNLQSKKEEKNKLRSVSRILQKNQKEDVTSEIHFTLRDRRRLDRAMGDTYQKKVNLLYYEQTEREAEYVRHRQEYGLE